MNKMNDKTIDAIWFYCPISLYENSIKVVLTGTALLCIYGLIDEFDDVDLLVLANDQSWRELLSILPEENIDEGYSSVKVECGGFTYNIIRDDYYNEQNLISYDGLYLDTLSHALAAKARLNREKDLLHFEFIKNRIDKLTKKSRLVANMINQNKKE